MVAKAGGRGKVIIVLVLQDIKFQRSVLQHVHILNTTEHELKKWLR